jgi:hypothetical protein
MSRYAMKSTTLAEGAASDESANTDQLGDWACAGARRLRAVGVCEPNGIFDRAGADPACDGSGSVRACDAAVGNAGDQRADRISALPQR